MVLCPDVYSLILGLALHADVPENCAFDAADSFSGGLAVVYSGGFKWGYIDKNGDRLRVK